MKRSQGTTLLAALLLAGAVFGQAPGTVHDGRVVRSARDEIARLERELQEQRALLVRILELQVEHDQQLLKLAQTGQLVALPAPAPLPYPTPVAEPAPVPEPRAEPREEPTPRRATTATLSGTLKVKGASGPAWVFLSDVRGPATNGAFEIRQEDKQFSPRVAAVPHGTRVTFPNEDSIFHNVFSVSAGNAFDLGTARKGDAVKSHVMTTPGVVDIFCNMHSRMSASLLVTPSNFLTKVAPDGSFRLENVPLGPHKISAWAGGQSIASQPVEVTANGAQVALHLDVGAQGPHLNKVGQPYGSYGD